MALNTALKVKVAHMAGPVSARGELQFLDAQEPETGNREFFPGDSSIMAASAVAGADQPARP